MLRRDGTVWTTDKDGIVLGLLAAEMMAVTGRSPGELYEDLTREFGTFAYQRIDVAATPDQKAALRHLSPRQITDIAGDTVTSFLTNAPGNGASIGGLKVMTGNGWFAVRPSGTEDVYKLYAESFIGSDHLGQIQEDAQAIIGRALGAGGQR